MAMKNPRRRLGEHAKPAGLLLIPAACFFASPDAARAQDDEISVRVYGFAQADFIQDFNRVNPNWDDTLRPSRIPTEEGQFGDDGNSVIGARQSRLGAEGSQMVGGKDFYVKVEFDFFGVGVDEGKATPRFRHAYGSWGPILAGQTHSLFMDIDIFPNVVDYWGPAGMVFLRTPQIRWTFLDNGSSRIAIAIENADNDIDVGEIRTIDPALGESITAKEELPDLTGQFRYTGDWGHVQVAGILRDVAYETVGDPTGPSGSKTGWGVDLTSNIKIGERNKFLLGFVFGAGIASYMNDGGMDLAPETEPGDVLEAKAVPLEGLSLYYDHYWNDEFSSSIGWSRTEVDNTDFQDPGAFHFGDYASVNVLYTPADNLLFGVEGLYGQREDNDGASGEDFRIQFSAKYSFGATL